MEFSSHLTSYSWYHLEQRRLFHWQKQLSSESSSRSLRSFLSNKRLRLRSISYRQVSLITVTTAKTAVLQERYDSSAMRRCGQNPWRKHQDNAQDQSTLAFPAPCLVTAEEDVLLEKSWPRFTLSAKFLVAPSLRPLTSSANGRW